MPVHDISSGDVGIALYNGGGTPIAFRNVYICTAAGGGVYTWVEFSQLWRCTSANPGTGVYTWQQFAAGDKYRPTLTPQSVSATPGSLPGRPTVLHWTEDTTSPGGGSYQLNITPHNLTQGIQDSTILDPAPRASGAHTYSYATPAGWNSGDEIYFEFTYADTATGYTGPIATSSNVFLP